MRFKKGDKVYYITESVVDNFISEYYIDGEHKNKEYIYGSVSKILVDSVPLKKDYCFESFEDAKEAKRIWIRKDLREKVDEVEELENLLIRFL